MSKQDLNPIVHVNQTLLYSSFVCHDKCFCSEVKNSLVNIPVRVHQLSKYFKWCTYLNTANAAAPLAASNSGTIGPNRSISLLVNHRFTEIPETHLLLKRTSINQLEKFPSQPAASASDDGCSSVSVVVCREAHECWRLKEGKGRWGRYNMTGAALMGLWQTNLCVGAVVEIFCLPLHAVIALPRRENVWSGGL